jgi:hypothetical protein
LYVEETRSTLRFAASAKRIEMKPTVNEVVDYQALLKKLQIELAETKAALQKLQNRSNVDNSKGQSASVVPVADLMLSMRTQMTSSDTLAESGSTGGGLGQRTEYSNWMPTQTPILVDSKSKPEEDPPVSEVWFSMGSADKKCCGDLTSRLIQAERRSKYLEEKLEATNDLVGTLACELETARRNNVDCNQGSRISKDRVGALEEQVGMSYKGEGSVMRHYALYIGVLFYFLGQTDLFVASVIFIWLRSGEMNHRRG